MAENSMAISEMDLDLMEKEFKISLTILGFLLAVSAVLLKLAAHIDFFSRDFFHGYLPFALYLSPAILFSSEFFVQFLRDWVSGSPARKLAVGLYPLFIYSIYTLQDSTFQGQLFLTLFGWLFLPVLIYSFREGTIEHVSFPDLAVVLLLWLPVEFGKLSGFDIIFRQDIQIPAWPFVAPALGLYLFRVLRDLPGIGFSFIWRFKDLLISAACLLALSFLLVPLGTKMGFLRYSVLHVNGTELLKLFFGIYFLVAIPEELLFRGVIQNLLTRVITGNFSKLYSFLAGSVIFGLAHLNNPPQPNWRYAFLAFLAGLFYGGAYLATGKTTISAIVHCGVDLAWAVFFKDTPG